MWVRGLKPVFFKECLPGDKSHPMWVRGLKLYIVYLFCNRC